MNNNVTVGGNLTKSINFAMQQNYVPVMRNLIVNNVMEEDLIDLDLKITVDPDFAKEYLYHIDKIPAGESVEISPVRIQLKTEFLFSLTEKIMGTITVELFRGEEKLYSVDNAIELLAYDQWSGLLFMPEIIVAYVTPNHPIIAEVIRTASEILRTWSGNPAFTGYQTKNPNNVKLQMAAIYTSLCKQGVIYMNPLATYESIGQRIRLPHVVLEQKQGTCLDLAVLYATCLEAVGLYPLLIFKKGHAFAGCWLEEETFADCMVDDISAIEKRIAEGAQELLLVECTDFVSSKNIEFDKALKHGQDHLIARSDFECVIDVQRSRGSGIRPIPLRLEAAYATNSDSKEEKVKGNAPTALDTSLLGKVAQGSNEPITKQKIWERKLLDFSLRNTLLNFRVTKNAFQLMAADLGELEDRLSDGKDFRVMEIPTEWTQTLRDSKMFEIETEKDLIQNIATQEFKSYRIRTFLDEKELEKNLKNLYRAAKMGMEENGTNTLFLALGFLRWFESDVSEKARYAPIILIPIDIVRNVRNKGYVLRSRQEDAQVNVTLLEYLRQDHSVTISGLDPLPEDEHGVDLPLVFNTIRQAIKGKNRWNIDEMAFVGLFSFGQFIMWNDIRNRSQELESNKIVSSLMKGAMNWVPDEQTITVDNLDANIALNEMAIPVSVDSSQMVAIVAAAAGQSFVLHGPPGTGKSQTITNMIANALYQGKTVLFVAEKMVALNVVQKRLADIGLDPFCLELHSNKTNKTSVFAELNKVLEVGKIKSPEEYETTAEKIHEMRNKLNSIIEALHRKRVYGGSLYEAIEYFEKNLEQKGKVVFSREEVTQVDKEKIEKWDELIRQYGIVIAEMGKYETHPFLGFEGVDYSIEMRDQFQTELNSLLLKHEQTSKHMEAVFEWAGGFRKKTRNLVEQLIKAVESALIQAVTLSDLIVSNSYKGIITQLKRLVQTGNEYNQMYQTIASQYEVSIFDYQVEMARLQWKNLDNAWFLPKLLGQKKLLKELKLYAKNSEMVTKENIHSIYDMLSTFGTKKKEMIETPVEISSMLAGLFAGASTDWNAVNLALEKAEEIHNACMTIPEINLYEMIKEIQKVEIHSEISIHKNMLEEYMSSLDCLKETYNIDMSMEETSLDWFENSKKLLEGYHGNIGELRTKVRFNLADNQLRANGLDVISSAYKKGEINADNIFAAYTCNLYYEIVLMTIGKDDILKEFNGKQYDDLIMQYKEAIESYQQLTVQELVARLSAKVPASGNMSSSSSEMGILKKAIKNNGRMLSLRRLFDQIPTLLRKLCPCMLMSPISVAQYIDPSFPKFDLVIFDEASQLPTSESVGTIARGENVVIVGDPKQLPPSNFFASNRIDEENTEKEDLESLLDDCLAISMPQESLKWHYRSRHESLIAYSNMKYYDNKLYTFPSPRDLVSEVKLVPVEGFYDKGKTKHNKAEADAIVAEIIRRLKDEELRKDSIGVVTFSSVQQNLIDDMLYEEFKKYPELEEIDRNSKETIFVKNLENVQGDERDIILFSVGYGPDAEGKVSMNFGPLNRDGGWRRLNVAISRARKSMIVYSVLKPEQIDLARTRSEGVVGLKGFLEFAERGKNVLVQPAGIHVRQEEYLVSEISAAIVELGYEVKSNIGCSAFKMDIGVVNPKDKDTYLLGILLDGENCKEASTARDRFVSQPSVLNGLGWSVMRIWTLDWLDDAQRVKTEIKAAINAGVENAQTVKQDKKPSYAKTVFEQEEVIIEASSASQYLSADILQQGLANDFYLPHTLPTISSVASKIIETESPISKKLLMKKVLNAWTISRGGSRVEEVFTSAVAAIDKNITKDKDREFFWGKNQSPDHYSGFRVEDSEGNKRNMDDIPAEEIINAIIEVLKEQVSISEDDLVRETAKKFGFSRLGNIIDGSVRYATRSGLDRGVLVKLESENIVLNEKLIN